MEQHKIFKISVDYASLQQAVKERAAQEGCLLTAQERAQLERLLDDRERLMLKVKNKLDVLRKVAGSVDGAIVAAVLCEARKKTNGHE